MRRCIYASVDGPLSLARFPGHTYSVGEEPTARYIGKQRRSFSEEFTEMRSAE